MSLWQAVGEANAALALLLSEEVQRSPHAYLEPLGVGVFHLPEANTDTLQFALYLDAVRIDDRYIREPAWRRLDSFGPFKEQLQRSFPKELGKEFVERGWAFIAPPLSLQQAISVATGDVVIAGVGIHPFGRFEGKRYSRQAMVARLTQRICTGNRGIGNPMSGARNMTQISELFVVSM